MNPSVLFASLHHLAAFTVVAMLAVEVAIFKPPLSAAQARRIQRVDTITTACVKRVRTCLMLELTAMVVILPCAALMARGFGYR